MRDARNDRPRTSGFTSGSSSAPSNDTNAGTTTSVSSSRSSRSLGQEPTPAARAALASPAQGLYEPLHWALLVADVPFDLDHILAVTRSVGLDAERLVRDMEDPSLDGLIERNAAVTNALGVRGTPAFVIGVVERPLLTFRNVARSMDYRADPHRTYAPSNITQIQ